jgi:2'-5' RNA ligase
MGLVRVFVAVKTDAAAQSALGEVMTKLSATRADVKWVHDFNLHLTVKFLGDTDEGDLKGIQKGLESAASRFGPLNITINGVDAIPNINYPRVVCANLGGDVDRLTDLAHAVEAELFNIGIPKEARDFFPHITLGRVKSFRGKSKLLMELRKFHKKELAGMVVEKIHLIKSELKPGGAIYEDLATVALT